MDIDIMNKNNYYTIINHCQELVIGFDESGKVIMANDISKKELSSDGIVEGMNITDIFPLAVFKQGTYVYWNQNEQVTHTFAYRKNQTCFPVKLNVMWEFFDEKKTGIAYAINDIERSDAVKNHQKAMEEVAEATKMKNEFTANITHELRTPINGIKGMTEGLFDTELTQEQEDTLSIILKCCENMTHIINDILDFSKIEAGKLSVEYREFNFKKFLDDLLVMNATKINEKGLKLVVDVGKSVPTNVIGDELRLGQVLNNLFSNATKFTSQGQIGLEVANTYESDEDVELFFMVMDSGIGISSEEKDKLFKSFSQVDGSITRRFGGTGLGLAICKQLVGLMGGTISVDSEKGKGSTFSFSVRFKKSKSGAGAANFPEGHFVYDKKRTQTQVVQQETMGAVEEKMSTGFFINTDEPVEEVEENEDLRIVSESLERLLLCIDLGAWEKGEGFASEIKSRLADKEKELKTLSFQLLLSVRKEDNEKATELMTQLEELLSERK